MKRLFVALSGSAFILAGCNSTGKGGGAPTVAAASGPVNVNTVPVQSRKLSTTIVLPAQLEPYEQVDIYPKVTGFVETVSVDRGSRVKAGQVLVRLTAPELASQRSQAEAAVRVAESQLATAKAKLASDQGTFEHMQAAAKTPGVLAANDVAVAGEAASADKGLVDAAEQNIAATRESLKTVSQAEAYLTITAPFEGVVTTRNLHPGALIGPAAGSGGAQPILQIVDDRRLRLVIPVPEAEVGSMKLRQPVAFSVPAYPGQTFEAPITRIAEALDEKSRTMPVELDVMNRDGKLAPGSFASVMWPLTRGYPTLFVPATAVTNDQQHTFVIRVREGKAEWVNVQAGQTVHEEIEVFGGLTEGDQVVKIATDAIHNGDAVRAQAGSTGH